MKKRVDFIMKFGIMIIAIGARTLKNFALKSESFAPYFFDLRRMPIGEAEVSLVGSVFHTEKGTRW